MTPLVLAVISVRGMAEGRQLQVSLHAQAGSARTAATSPPGHASSSASPSARVPAPGPVTRRSWLIATITGIPRGSATQQNIAPPCAMTSGNGSLYLADGPFGYTMPSVVGYTVTRVSAATGRLATVAGFGQGDGGFSPDGTPAAAALLGFECGIAVDAAGNMVLSGSNGLTRTAAGGFGWFGNHLIRVVAARSGVYYGRSMLTGRIYTIAGEGGRGFGGDGARPCAPSSSTPAPSRSTTRATLSSPTPGTTGSG